MSDNIYDFINLSDCRDVKEAITSRLRYNASTFLTEVGKGGFKGYCHLWISACPYINIQGHHVNIGEYVYIPLYVQVAWSGSRILYDMHDSTD